jgi:hypothetical protein
VFWCSCPAIPMFGYPARELLSINIKFHVWSWSLKFKVQVERYRLAGLPSAPWTKKWRRHLLVKMNSLPVLLATQRRKQFAASAAF